MGQTATDHCITITTANINSGKAYNTEKKRHGGKHPNRNLLREEAARGLHADYILSESEANPYGDTVPTFSGTESERRLRVNAGVYDCVKAGDVLLQILTTCWILHNMAIEDKEVYGEDNIAGTRNIISFDESAPPSDMVQILLPETREAHAEHWREATDLVENNEQPVSLNNAFANHIWNKHGSGGDTE
jgi:hypothetical protein